MKRQKATIKGNEGPKRQNERKWSPKRKQRSPKKPIWRPKGQNEGPKSQIFDKEKVQILKQNEKAKMKGNEAPKGHNETRKS